jgi:hypothetical protein
VWGGDRFGTGGTDGGKPANALFDAASGEVREKKRAPLILQKTGEKLTDFARFLAQK